MKDLFLQEENVAAVNKALQGKTGEVSRKTLSVSMDTTTRASWETGVIPHLDDIPLTLVGKGEQNSIKIKLAVEAEKSCQIVLMEEPENHLTHINLNKLISHLQSGLSDKQAILTTHSSFVLNKLGVEKVVMFDGKLGVSINDLPDSTERFFRKAPGHDTLRMILAPKSILVEGPSDELVVQRAILDKFGATALESGIEVISVRSLAFKRFLDIASLLDLKVAVVTDNDSNHEKVIEKYREYSSKANIKICSSDDDSLPTLEPHLLAINGREKLNRIFEKTFDNDRALLNFMENNKSECALNFLDTDDQVFIPDYIRDALE
ncbi:ATP-dependent endonuclease [Sphingopyxis sp. BSNA05]|uniref:ATP-dependent nuclease n=1 Tax=Sphingopyxis sp. BSNA05 TaxID=1236614 RepID=UPI001C27F1A7|nr:TOPRIM nucleotidyl transferase/hydrolase domain-containing protein [Sphingopyxis sp. BSNA05]